LLMRRRILTKVQTVYARTYGDRHWPLLLAVNEIHLNDLPRSVRTRTPACYSPGRGELEFQIYRRSPLCPDQDSSLLQSGAREPFPALSGPDSNLLQSGAREHNTEIEHVRRLQPAPRRAQGLLGRVAK
jgi:hypothetical protein